MINSQPWAITSNFEAFAVYFEIILKKLCNSYGNILLTKNALNYLKNTRRLSIFQNYFKTASKQPLFGRTGTYDSPCTLMLT